MKSAFLQGVTIRRDVPLFVKIPQNWPSATLQHLNKHLAGGMRKDYSRICKGIFGLGESFRLFHFATVHVDDLMCTGHEKGLAVFERPRKIFTSGE